MGCNVAHRREGEGNMADPYHVKYRAWGEPAVEQFRDARKGKARLKLYVHTWHVTVISELPIGDGFDPRFYELEKEGNLYAIHRKLGPSVGVSLSFSTDYSVAVVSKHTRLNDPPPPMPPP
jgi:hypothetical protein